MYQQLSNKVKRHKNCRGTGKLIRYSDSLQDWTVWGSNPGCSQIFRTRPGQPWGLSSFMYNRYRVYPGRKASRAWSWPSTPSTIEVTVRVELCIYFHSGPSWPVLGRTLPLTKNRQSVIHKLSRYGKHLQQYLNSEHHNYFEKLLFLLLQLAFLHVYSYYNLSLRSSSIKSWQCR
jgi:hypothetical protein